MRLGSYLLEQLPADLQGTPPAPQQSTGMGTAGAAAAAATATPTPTPLCRMMGRPTHAHFISPTVLFQDGSAADAGPVERVPGNTGPLLPMPSSASPGPNAAAGNGQEPPPAEEWGPVGGIDSARVSERSRRLSALIKAQGGAAAVAQAMGLVAGPPAGAGG
jgi:hypothetical protein